MIRAIICNCPNGTYNDSYICKEYNQEYLLNTYSASLILFKEENSNYFIETNTTETNKEYFLNSSDLIEQCYYTCKKCLSNGNALNHNCLQCKDEFPFEEIFTHYKNCYNINEFDIKIKQIQFDIINNFILSYANNKTILVMKDKNVSIILTTTYNQSLNGSEVQTSINLGKCEYKLKDTYNISYNDSLYILKIEVNETGMKIPKIEYEVYYSLYDKNLVKLNLSVCKEYKAEISIPVYINDNIEKYNQSSDYYNDICSKTTSKYGTDICIKDRKDEFIENNMTLCEENCDLIDYDYNNKKMKCSCKIKLSLPLIEEIKIDTDELYKR